jgi:predicted amidohydrolase
MAILDSPIYDPTAPRQLINQNIEKMFGYLHKAGRLEVDLICTHEDFTGASAFAGDLDYPEIFSSLVEEIPGPISQELGKIAKQYHMHIAANYNEKDNNKIYNTSVLIGRDGELIGKYRKVHLPPSEKWRVSSGDQFSVFMTDIGRIGFATCYDIIFPEHCRAIALNGADIIIHQTMGWGVGSTAIGEELVRTRAAENSVYMVVAKNIQSGDNGMSCIIDNYGNIIAEGSGTCESIVSADVAPDFDMVQCDHYNALFSGVSSIKARQVLEREPSLYSVLSQQTPPMLDRYQGVGLHTSPEQVSAIYRSWKQYEKDSAQDQPVKIKYHW